MRRVAAAGGRRRVSKPNSWIRRLGRFKNRFPQLLRTDFWRTSGRRRLWNSMFRARGKAQGETPDIPTVTVRRKPKRAAVRQTARQASPPRWLENLEPRRMLAASPVLYVDNNWTLVHDDGSHTLSVGDLVSDGVNTNLVYGTQAFGKVTSSTDPNVTISSPTSVAGAATIQDAINLAETSATGFSFINVYAGSYSGPLNISPSSTQNLTIINLDSSGNPALGVLGSVVINAGSASTGITIGSNATATISGIKLQGIGIAGTGINDKGVLDLLDSQVALSGGALIGINVDNSGGGSTGFLFAQSDQVSGAGLFGIEAGGGANAQATIDKSEITDSGTADVAVSAGNVTITNSILSSTAASARGLLVLSAGNASVYGSDLSNNPIPVTNTNTATTIDASGNWWGNTSETTVLGETQGSVDITPYLDSGTDTDGGAVGFLGDFSQLSVTALGPQVEATGRIQEAVTDLTAGGTIHVNAGTYAENVTIDKSLSLLGAQVGNSASTRFGNFASGKADPAVEAILTTPSVDNGSGPPFNDLIRVTADDVTIDGLVLDGNNAALVQTGATEVGGVDADARRGIDNIDTTGTPISISGLTVQNDILQNFDDRAISLFNNGDLPATNDAIAGNVISNFAGFGVLLLDDAYADITHNTILGPTFATGIQLQNFFGGVDSMTWSNNNITLGQDGTGIFVNLFYAPGATVSITGNTINAASGVTPGDSSGLTFGIGVDSVQAGASVTLTSNIIGNNGPTGGEFDRGVDFWDDPTSATISYTGGSISNARVGVELDNVDPFFGGANVDTTVSVSGVTISAVQYGVLVNGTPLADASLLVGPSGGGNPNVVAGSVSLDLAGSSITTSSPTGVDVLVEAQSTGTFTAGVDLTGGTSISGGATGVAVSGANATATVSGATIDDPTTGILVSGGSAIISNTNIYNNTTGVQFTAGGSGSLSTNNFNGDPNPDNGTDLLINSTAGLVALLGGNIFAGTTFIDDQASGELNATGETFVLTGSSTVLPADNTLADLYSVEDRIKDGIDQSGPGLVRLRSGKVFVSHGSEVGPQGSAGAIQRAINLATSGDTVNVQAGAFAGGINVNKALTLVGAGSGASDTVISLASGNVLAISASGPDAVHPVTIRGVQISGGTRGVELNGTLSHLLLDNVVVTGATNYGIEVDNAAVLSDLNLNDVSVSTNTTSGVGFNVSTTGAVSGLTITTSHFDNNAFGLETQNAVGSLNNQTRFTNINISGTSFSNNTFKGIYVETLDDAVLNGITITDSGTGATSPAGIDINLKYGTYSGGITIENSTLTDDGTGNSLASPSPGVGLTIKGRNDAPSYNSDPASLTNVTLQNDTITGSPIDLAIGNNVSGVSLSGVQLQGSGLGLDYYGTAPGTLNLGDTAFDGALVGYILNASANNIDTTGGATFNSFNTGAGPVAGNVPTYYAIEDKIADGIDAPGPGYVQLATGNEFVTPGSFENLGAAPFTTTSADVQRAVNAAGTGDTVYIEGGSYTGNVDTGSKNLRLELGASPASVSISGNLTLHSGDTVHLEVNAAGNDLLTVSGNVDLGGATLDTTGDTNPLQYPAGQSATILIKSSAGAITGTFAGMSDGDEINVDGEAFIIYYTGGSGNDVVLTSLGPAVIPPPPGGPFSPPGAPTVVFVDDDWASFADGSDPDGPSGGSFGNGTAFGYDEFSTIQAAENALASSGGTIYVYAGRYAENITLTKSGSLIGAQFDQDANSRLVEAGDPSLESIITSPDADTTTSASNLINILASNVIINGFVVDGSNPNIPGSGAHNGIATVDSGNNGQAVNNIVIENNIVQNVGHDGIALLNPTNGSAVTSGDLVTGNVIRSFVDYGIILAYNAYGDVTFNTITMPDLAEAGVRIDDFTADGGTAATQTINVAHNTITAGQDDFGGIWANLDYAPTANLFITDNTVNAAAGVTGTDGFTNGIYLSSLQNGFGATLSGNIVGSTGGQFATGISLWNLSTANTVSVSGGSIGNSLVGIEVDNDDINFGAGADTAVSISGITSITASNIGILVDGDASGGDVSATITGPMEITGGNTGISVTGVNASADISGVTIDPPATGVSVIDGSATITGNTITSDGDGIDVSGGAHDVIITGNTITAQANGIGVYDTADVEIGDGTVGGANQIDAGIDGITVQDSATASIDKNTIFNDLSLGGAGVQVLVNATASIDNNTFDVGGQFGTDLEIHGAITGGAISGNAFDATDVYIENDSADDLDATVNTFSTIDPAVATMLAQLYGIEDKIIDGIDQLGSGLVRIKAENVYVAHSSEVAPQGSAGSIQRAVNLASSGDTVYVQAGVYVGEVDIEIPLTLLGAQAGVNPNTSPPALGSQTIIEPDVSDPDIFDAGSVIVVYVGSSNVTLDGFTVDGDNPALASDPNTVSFNGADIDAAIGIAAYSDAGNITLQNNVLRNFGYTAIDLYGNFAGGSATSGNLVKDNFIDNLTDAFGFGIGIDLEYNLYAQVTGNVIHNATVGIQTGNFFDANPDTGFAPEISSNQIQASGVGIFFNLMYDATSTFTVADNSISAINAPGDAPWQGVLITSIQSSAAVTFSGNTIDGTNAADPAGKPSAGYEVWNTPTAGDVLISGGSVSNVDYGVWVNTYEGYQSNAGVTQATISGVSIAANLIGVYVEDSAANTLHPAVSAEIDGDTDITTGPSGTGILVSGANASAKIHDNDASIHGNLIGIEVNGGSAIITGNHIYDNGTGIEFTGGGTGTVTGNDFTGATANGTDLLLTNTAANTVVIGAGNLFAGSKYFIDDQSSESFNLTSYTSANFDGLNPTTLSGDFRIEDRMHHREDTDLPVTTGLITWVAGNLFVTAPATHSTGSSDTDSDIQRGVDSASSGNTIHVEAGTFNLITPVVVNKTVLLLGAQSGVDARTRSGAETIVSGDDGDFQLEADQVTIDGFTLTGVTNNPSDPPFTSLGVAIWMNPGAQAPDHGGAQIFNNIIDGNIGGIELNNDGTFQTVVQHNLIENNNAPGPDSGSGIETSFGLQNALIDSNKFVNNANAAVVVEAPSSTLTISNNDADSGIDLFDTASSGVTGNTFTSPSGDAIFLGGGDSDITVSGNSVTGIASGSAGLDISNPFGAGPNNNITVSNNTWNVNGGGGAAIEVDDVGTPGSAYTGTLTLSGDQITTTGADLSIENTSSTPILATGETFNTVLASSASTTQQYAIVDTIVDGVDVSGFGLVRTNATNVYVTPNSFFAPTTTTPSIQRGVDVANSGDTVNIENGTYIGQVVIDQDLTLLGESAGAVIQAPSHMSQLFNDGFNNRPVVLVMDAGNVTIQNLTVDGAGQGNDYPDEFEGIGFDNAGGKVDHVTITGIRDNPLDGDQGGFALYASLNGIGAVPRSLTITNNDINDYQKAGILLYAPGAALTADIDTNTITGAGPTALLAQNGIEIDGGVDATINNNHISGDSYIPASVDAAGILLFGSGSVTNNVISGTDIGVYAAGTTGHVDITGNMITGSKGTAIVAGDGQFTISGNTLTGAVGNGGAANNTGDGIDIYDTSDDTTAFLDGNIITNNTGYGLAVSGGAQVLAQNNTLTGDNVGVYVADGATVDLGYDSSLDSDLTHANFTGLGSSTGHNILTGYTGLGGHYAIDDENLKPTDPDVLAEDNNFGPYTDPSVLENYIYDSHDNPTHTTVFILGALNQVAAPSTVFVNWTWAGTVLGTDADGPTGGSMGNGTAFGVDEFATIQDAINAVAPGGTVDVYNGPYFENVDVTKSVTITGESEAGVKVYSAISDPTGGSLGSPIFLLDASDVTIQDLTVDGDNTSLTSGVEVGGADIDASTGIITDWDLPTSFTGMTILNVTVQNIYERGIEYADGNDFGTGTIDFENDTITNVQGDPSGSAGIFNFGGNGTIANNTVSNTTEGINMNWSNGTAVNGNSVMHSGTGIHSDNNGGAGGVADSIHDNHVSLGTAGSFGIFVFDPYVNTSVANNIIGGVDVGLAAFGGAGGTATFSGNTVSVKPGGVGAYVSTNTAPFGFSDVSASFSGDSFTGGDAGIQLDQSAGGTATASISNVTIDDPTVGIVVDGGSATITGNHIYNNGTGIEFTDAGHGSLSGNNFDGGANPDNGTDLLIDSTAGTVTIGDGNTFAATDTYIDNESSHNFDLSALTTTTFGGFNAATSAVAGNLASFYGVEDKITDALDQASSGYVRIKSGYDFLAHSSEVAHAGSLQRVVNVAHANDIVEVQAGTYAGNVSITKTLTFLGAQAGQNANTRYSAFATGANGPKANDTLETIITATVSDPTSVFDLGNNVLVRVLTSGVTLDGFVIDGNNPALTHQGTTLSGIAVDAGDGIGNVDGTGNLVSVGDITLENNIVQNVNGEGVYFDLGNGATPTTGSLVQGNVVSNAKYDGIGLFNNFYGDVETNTIRMPDNDVFGGIDLQSYYNVPGNIDVSGNTITEGQDDVGVFINLIFSPGTVIDVHDNIINAATGVAPGGFGTYGIAVWSVQVGSTVTMTDNDIGNLAGSGIFDQGIDLWNLPTSNHVSISGGSIANSAVGIELDAVNPFYGAGDPSANSTVDIDGVNITGGTIGILADAKSLASTFSGSNIVSSDVTLNITGATISGAPTGIQIDAPINVGNYTASADISGDTDISGASTGILITGANASAGIHDNDASIHGNTIGIEVSGGSAMISNDHIYDNTTGIEFTAGGSGSVSGNNFAGATDNVTDLFIDSTAGAVTIGNGNSFAGSTDYIVNLSSQSFDLSSNTSTFGGVNPGTLAVTPANLPTFYGIEDKLVDAIDRSGSGFIRLHAGNVFVTPNSFYAPEVSDTGALQRAIDAAASGDVVNIEAGTYTLSANVSIDKSITLAGPNVGNSPLAGGPTRVAEAIINGGAPGPFTGSSGFVFNLLTGITSLIVEGLTFTNFDGNLFASSLVPVTTVTLEQNIFNANNGGLFYKFDDAVPTTFTVEDNRITNQSMTGANTALFFLGNVANSHFDNNEVTNVSSRELVNVFTALNNTTFDNNTLTNTAGLVALFADQSGVHIDNNTISNTTTGGGGAAIYVGTNNGHTITNLDISGNSITTVHGGIGVKLAVDTAGTGSITNVTVDNNTISGTDQYGLLLDTFAGSGTGTISNVSVEGNHFTDNAFGPILAYARVTSGTNTVSNLTIDQNTFAESASVFTASFYLVDLRNVSGANSFSDNSFTLSGTLPAGTDAIRDISIRGSQTGTFNITQNTFDGGNVTHNNAPTVFVTAIVVMSNDATTGALPSTAVINISNNLINHFEDGITVRDGVGAVYGNLPTGVQLNIHNNDLSGNSQFALHTGTTGAVVDASGNWWGANTEAGVQAKISSLAKVDYTPWLDSGTNSASGTGFDGDFSTLDVGAGGAQVQAGGRINEAIADLTAGGTIQVFPGTYAEDVLVNKALTLESVGGASVTTISDPAITATVTITANNVNFGVPGGGFTIQTTAAGTNWALNVQGSNAVVKANTFQSTHAGNVITADNTDTFSGNIFDSPTAASQPGFLQYEDSSDFATYSGSSEILTLLANNTFDRGVTVSDSSGDYLGGVWSNINAGIFAASVGNTVAVLAGTYDEDVNVNKSLTLKGAQAGVTAPGRSGAESIINSPDGKTELEISASDATVDGFTIQGNTNDNVFGYGVYITPSVSGTHVFNNIVQNNIAGLALANASATDQAQIEGNLFQNNNNAGSASGTGIYADQFTAGGVVQDVLISGNTFTNSSFVEDGWGIGISNSGSSAFSNITVSFNTFSNLGRGMYFYNSTGVSVDANTVTGATHYAVGIFGDNTFPSEPGNSSISITRNTLNNDGVGVEVEGVSGPTALAFTGGTLNVANNFLDNNTTGVLIDANGLSGSATVHINANHIAGNTSAGLENDSVVSVDASGNWWGSADGPNTSLNTYHPNNPTGDKVLGTAVTLAPWLTSGVDAQPATPGFQPTVNGNVPLVAVSPEAGNNNNEGSSQSYDATVTATTDPVSYYWTVTKNSNPYASGSTLETASLTNTFSFTPDDNAAYVVTVTVVDQNGNSDTVFTSVAIQNVPPTITLMSTTNSVLTGQSIHFTFTTTDPAGSVDAPFSLVSDSGGTYGTVSNLVFNSATGSGSFDVTFNAPAGHNTSTVSVQDEDKDGGISNLSSIVVNIANTLQVTAFQRNSSGFDVTFNRSPNLADLNLYDGSDAVHDLPDILVVLNGDTAHPILGSMSWDAATNTLSWVKTGSPLADGNYSVTLVSGQNGALPMFAGSLGFMDSLSSGDLDGNQNGNDTENPDNYTASFNVTTAAGTVTVSIPDFARGPGQHVDYNPASPGSQLPVILDNANGVTSLDFDLFYNPALLTVNGAFLVSGLPGMWFATTNTTIPGELIVTASGSQPLSGTNVPVILISTDVPANAPYESSQVLRIENAKVNGDINFTKDDFTIQKVLYLGDADGSGAYGAGDYSRIQRVAVQLDTGFDAEDWTDPLIVADITDAPSNPPSIDGFDASFVLQKALGQTVPQIPNIVIPTANLVFSTSGADPSLLPSITPVAGGIVVSVSMNVEPAAAGQVFGITFDLTYDGSQLQFNPPTNPNDMLGSFTPVSAGWSVATAAISSGDLRVAINGSTNPAAVGSGVIINLPFSQLTAVDPYSLSIGINKNSDPHEDLVVWTPVNTGDVNLDGHVDAADIFSLESALVNVPGYQTAHGLTNDQWLYIADINRDGKVNNMDVQSLINFLLAGHGSTSSESDASNAVTIAAPVGNNVATASPSQTSPSSTFSGASTDLSNPDAKPLGSDNTLASNDPPPVTDDSVSSTTTVAPVLATQAVIASTEFVAPAPAEVASSTVESTNTLNSELPSDAPQSECIVTVSPSVDASASEVVGQGASMGAISTMTQLAFGIIDPNAGNPGLGQFMPHHEIFSADSPPAASQTQFFDDFYAHFARQTRDAGNGNSEAGSATDHDAVLDDLYGELNDDLMPAIS